MYEVLLGTAGLMQIGWCTVSCRFNREEGVGDTKTSFAFDGYRETKWTARNSVKYGEVIVVAFSINHHLNHQESRWWLMLKAT